MIQMLWKIVYTTVFILFIIVITLVIIRQLNIFTEKDAIVNAVFTETYTEILENETPIESVDKSIEIVEEYAVDTVESVGVEPDVDIEVTDRKDTPIIVELIEVNDTGVATQSGLLTLFNAENGALSVGGVVLYTNTERFEKNFVQLTPNTKLHKAAVAKIDDMIANQYFEHISPLTGNNVSYLVEMTGYEYIVVGENLAMGNFKNDKDLVDEWMSSEGHRDNILNERFTEIGVAVEKGVFEGRELWFAVQIFGRPLSLCDAPSTSLTNTINSIQVQADTSSQILEDLLAQIESTKNKYSNTYKILVSEYNEVVFEYNSLINTLKEKTDMFNEEVRIYNLCINAK